MISPQHAEELADQLRQRVFHDFLLRQELLQRTAYGADLRHYDGEERVTSAKDNVLAAMVELGELLGEIDGWKPWQTEREHAGEFKDRDKWIEELVDVLHFVANLLILAGCTDDELSAAFITKQQINRLRQEVGYSGVGAEFQTTEVAS